MSVFQPQSPFVSNSYENGQVGDVHIDTQEAQIQQEILQVIDSQSHWENQRTLPCCVTTHFFFFWIYACMFFQLYLFCRCFTLSNKKFFQRFYHFVLCSINRDVFSFFLCVMEVCKCKRFVWGLLESSGGSPGSTLQNCLNHITVLN